MEPHLGPVDLITHRRAADEALEVLSKLPSISVSFTVKSKDGSPVTSVCMPTTDVSLEVTS